MATLKRSYVEDLEYHTKRQRTVPYCREIQTMETLKRKCADDLDLHFKKQRTDSGILTPCHALETANDTYESVMPPEIEMPDENPTLSTAVSETNDRAIVLYKPPIQEVFGNSSIPRIKFDRRIVASGLMNDAELFRQCENSIRHHLESKNELALIPWVDPTSAIIIPDEIEACQVSSKTSGKDDDEMLPESETMEEDTVANVDQQFQPNCYVTQGETEPWKYYGLSQTGLGSTMWSR